MRQIYSRILYGILTVILIGIPSVNAENQIFITFSEDRERIIYDGAWTDAGEWKASSWDKIQYKGMTINLRTAHQGDYIYVMLNADRDKTIDNGQDRAMICFDGNNDKTTIPNTDDYCFIATVGKQKGIMMQGGSPIAVNGNFQTIEAHSDFIAVGGASSEKDPYEKTPHSTYEFKIPIELFGRSDNYGFFFSLYDASKDATYTWPTETQWETPLKVPSPSLWGDIISPDKSLPEFGWPAIALFASILIVIYFSRFGVNKNLFSIFK